MWKTLEVAQREYIETAKTKTFILMILMLPVMIGIIVFLAQRLNRSGAVTRPPMKIAVKDLSNQLSAQIKAAVDEHNASNPNRRISVQDLEDIEESDAAESQGKTKLRRGELDAYMVLEKDILEGSGRMRLYTYKPKPADIDALWAVEAPFRAAVVNQRCKKLNLSPELLDELRDVPIVQMDVGSSGEEEKVQRQADNMVTMMVPFFFMYLLFLGTVTMGQQMLSSIIEEKTSRIIEVLLSAVSPFQLMAGKILGLVGVGLTVVFLWGMAAVAAARWQGLNVEIAPAILPYFVTYYTLAFLLFGATMVGIGSVCNTIKETQSLMTPVMLFCIVPLLAWHNIVQDSNGTLARSLSFFPPMTPMVMILRLSAGSDVWAGEILATIIVLAAAVLATMWIAAKVFRTGILMYGKRPGLLEVARWLRQS